MSGIPVSLMNLYRSGSMSLILFDLDIRPQTRTRYLSTLERKLIDIIGSWYDQYHPAANYPIWDNINSLRVALKPEVDKAMFASDPEETKLFWELFLELKFMLAGAGKVERVTTLENWQALWEGAVAFKR